MKIYRYEANDGGGPWITFEGRIRTNPDDTNIYDDGYLCGCTSMKKLEEYFKTYEQDNLDFSKYRLVIYDVPADEIIFNKREVLFPKKYSPFYKPVSTIPDEL